MLRHLEWVYNDIQGTTLSWDSPLLLIGGHGVDLFFCISGFIIAYLLSERSRGTWDFFLRRFVRIYPMYWLFTVAYLAAVAVGCETGERTDCTQILDVDYLARSLLILPQATFPALSVGWSLEHEVIFYGVAGVICVMAGMPTRALLLSVLLLGGVGIVLNVISPAILGHGVWTTDVFSPYHFEFAAGIAVFMFRGELERLNPLICLAFGLVAFWVTHETGLITPGPGPGASPQTWQSGLSNLISVAGYSVASAAVLSGLVSAETRGVFRRGPRTLATSRQRACAHRERVLRALLDAASRLWRDWQDHAEHV